MHFSNNVYITLYFSAEFGLTDINYYQYLNYGQGHKIDDINDASAFQATLKGNNIFYNN